MELEAIIELSEKKIRNTSMSFIRPVIKNIDWNDRLISIVGPRGSGKTTLMLQHMKESYGSSEALYMSLDNIFFSKNKLLETADRFVKLGGKAIYLDEVHKYPDWSIELKNLYDDYPELKVVFSGSSMLELFRGHGDLSRRLSTYYLPTLSFREFIELEHKVVFPAYKLEDLLRDHVDIAHTVTAKIKPLALFEKYLNYGAFPFFKDSPARYHERLLNIVNLILESDLPSITPVDYSHVIKIKRILKIISESVPYKPNITKLAAMAEIDRKSVLKYLDLLNRARLIHILKSDAAGDSILTKPQKIYLGNPNLMFALCDEKPNYGTLRETFFFDQLSSRHLVSESHVSDFTIDKKYTFEIGGRTKNGSQIAGTTNGFVASDNLEYGYANHIPLWLFGFLY